MYEGTKRLDGEEKQLGEKKKKKKVLGTHFLVGVRLNKLKISHHLKSYQTLTQTER